MWHTAERSAAAVSVEEEGVVSGMLIRKHQWESTTKKASNRLVVYVQQHFYCGSLNRLMVSHC